MGCQYGNRHDHPSWRLSLPGPAHIGWGAKRLLPWPFFRRLDACIHQRASRVERRSKAWWAERELHGNEFPLTIHVSGATKKPSLAAGYGHRLSVSPSRTPDRIPPKGRRVRRRRIGCTSACSPGNLARLVSGECQLDGSTFVPHGILSSPGGSLAACDCQWISASICPHSKKTGFLASGPR